MLPATCIHATIYSSHPPANSGMLPSRKEEQAELDHLRAWRWAKVMTGGPLARRIGNMLIARRALVMFVFIYNQLARWCNSTA